LHAYGAEDPRVKIDHWTRLEPLLKRHAKDYQAIVEGKQGHGFRNQDASVSFNAALEAFLAKHLLERKSDVRVGEPAVVELPAK
jgi:dipeptidyl aminopeptidase/acylaminoacyl peptidase